MCACLYRFFFFLRLGFINLTLLTATWRLLVALADYEDYDDDAMLRWEASCKPNFCNGVSGSEKRL